MNFKVLVLLCLVLVVVLLTEDAEGRRCRRKCRFSCRVKCRFYRGRVRCRPRCGLHCHLSCRGRDEPEQMALDDENDPTVTLPHNFNDYDENKDGRISFNEFKNVVPTDNLEEAKQSFSSLDKDEDSFLNCNEFVKADLDFAEQPRC